MMKPTIELKGEFPVKFLMRSIKESDLEYIRKLKNMNREYFFYKDEISVEQQVKWFHEFIKRKHDYMFVILINLSYVGCIGTRYLDDHNDIYNVILGDLNYKGKGLMSKAISAIIRLNELLYPGQHNRVKVLNNNPAIKWYEKNGFEIMNSVEDYVWMELNQIKDFSVYKCNISMELPISGN